MIDFEKIFNKRLLGEVFHPDLPTHPEIAELAKNSGISPATSNPKESVLLAIDNQIDFMDYGSLGVPNALNDVLRLCTFIYDNIEHISRIICSLDTHNHYQIFHPQWWVNMKTMDHPQPFTEITEKDVSDGKWMPTVFVDESINYLKQLELLGRKKLMVWPYHCIQGTVGHALEPQFSNVIEFFSLARKSRNKIVVKGTDPLSEMYGILKPEYSKANEINIDLLNTLANYKTIFIAGQASSHCVYESVRQIGEFYQDKPEITEKIFVLTDCTSPVSGCLKMAEEGFEELKTNYKINLIKSTDFKF